MRSGAIEKKKTTKQIMLTVMICNVHISSIPTERIMHLLDFIRSTAQPVEAEAAERKRKQNTFSNDFYANEDEAFGKRKFTADQ